MEENRSTIIKQPLLENQEIEEPVPSLLAQKYACASGQRSSLSFFGSSNVLAQKLTSVYQSGILTSFIVAEDDIPPISGFGGFYKAFMAESSKLWYLAGPAILTSIFQYSLGAITQTFAGHIGTLDLAAFSIENSVIAGLSFGVMVRTLKISLDPECLF